MDRKLRAWNLQQKQMYSHEQLMELRLEFIGTIQQLTNELKFGFEFMESIGKQDKNSTEIYVNDLVRLKPFSWAYPHHVVYNENMCCYEMIDRDGDVKRFYDLDYDEELGIEIIGNVLENPNWMNH